MGESKTPRPGSGALADTELRFVIWTSPLVPIQAMACTCPIPSFAGERAQGASGGQVVVCSGKSKTRYEQADSQRVSGSV